MTSFVADFSKYTLRPGSKGKSVVASPEALNQLATMSQLRRFAENLGVAVDGKGSKLKASQAIFAALAAKGFKVEKAQAPGERAAKVVCALDHGKVGTLPEGWLRQTCLALTSGKSGAVEVTRETFTAFKIQTPKGGDAWRNFLWYKSKGHLQGVLA